ncbi:MAG: hypothetical protein K0S25_612 [Bacillus sp. (in: firmicutes)]|nr:hypothetical protein [Bacillus sp. (in: firmicutes)]
MNGSSKSTSKEEETSLDFDNLLQQSSGTDMEKEECENEYGLLNQFVQTFPMIQPNLLTNEPAANIYNEANSAILTLPQASKEKIPLQQGEMKTVNQIDPLTANILQSLNQDPALSEQKGAKKEAPLDVSILQPLGQDGTIANKAEPFEGSSIQQLAQGDVLGKGTGGELTVLNPSRLEKDKDSNQKELTGSHQVNGDSVNSALHKINFSPMQTTADTQEKPVLATPSPSVQATQFDQDVSQVLKSAMKVQQSKDGIEAAFTLAPDHLGKVDVKVSIKDGHVTAEFLASTSSGKNLLETNVHALRAALETQGLQVEKINITQQNTSSFMGTFSQKGDSNTRQGQQDSRKRNERIVNNQEKEYRDFGQDTGWVSQINTTA